MSDDDTAPLKPAHRAGAGLLVVAALSVPASVAFCIIVLRWHQGYGLGDGIRELPLAFVFAPWLALLALATIVIPPLAVALVLERRRSALILIGAPVAVCALLLGVLVWRSVDAHRKHDRIVSGVRALAGLHGEKDGVRFTVRSLAGSGLIDVRVDFAGGRTATTAERYWVLIYCSSKDVEARFELAYDAAPVPGDASALVHHYLAGGPQLYKMRGGHPYPNCSFTIQNPDTSRDGETFIPVHR